LITPSDSRIPYDWRSPATYASDLAARKDFPMLLVQGNADTLIEPAQACELAQGAWGTTSVNFYLGSNHQAVLDPSTHLPTYPPGVESNIYLDQSGNPVPTSCASYSSLVWSAGSPPSTSWSTTQPYLLVYDGLTHDTVLPVSPLSPPA